MDVFSLATYAATGLNIKPQNPNASGLLSSHAWSTLREDGNLGGPAVLAVLTRTHSDPPASGSRGVLLGVGPGCDAACIGTWKGEQYRLG